MNWFKNGLILFGFLILIPSYALSQDNAYKLCVTGRYDDLCEQLQRGKSEVRCIQVQDSVECALKLKNDEADFGVFSPENALHVGTLNWPNLVVVKQLRHSERFNAETDFESVVVVKSDYNNNGTLLWDNLRGKKFCHPGFYYGGKSNKWSERFLKQFERTVTTPVCAPYKSSAEIEALTLSTFFGASCRPGKWSHDVKEDAELKKKYPSLCKLCNENGNNCEYNDFKTLNDHQKALQCLKNRGDVAYVSRQETENFFKNDNSINASDYRYLCPDGSLLPVNKTNATCSWLRQPWKVIISRSAKSIAIEKQINTWLSNSKNGGWEGALAKIIDADSYVPQTVTMESPSEYIRKYRSIPLPEQFCDAQVSWCTVTSEENEKCIVIRQAGITAGVYPLILCRDPTDRTINCLDDLSKNISDFVGIDSNYGYLARTVYNLTPAMYYETETQQYSSIVVVVHDNSKYKKFEDLKGAQVCLPEFGGTPSIAFINLGKSLKFFNRKECRYHKILKNFFGDSCAPGAEDIKFFRNFVTNDPLCKLCLNTNGVIGSEVNVSSPGMPSVTLPESQITCAADETNRYYGNRGALKCLHEAGDVAILELQSLQEHANSLLLNEFQFRIICRNGSLANRPGFDVDLDCALTTIVDGEILVRRGTNKTSSIINVLSALDTYFQGELNFKMYNEYNGKKSLLFKDSTIGLTSIHEQNFSPTVENYIKLFKNIEDCQQGHAATKSIFSISIIIAFVVSLRLF